MNAALYAARAGFEVELVVPTREHYNFDLINAVQREGALARVVPVPGGYMKRNDALAESSDELLAFTETSKETRRSGTWATVRRFRKLGKVVTILPLYAA